MQIKEPIGSFYFTHCLLSKNVVIENKTGNRSYTANYTPINYTITYIGLTDEEKNNAIFYTNYVGIKQVKIYRIYNETDDVQEIFYSINNQPKVKINDLSAFNPVFTQSVWFGAAPKNANANEAQRYLVGTLSNMYIKVGKYQ